MASVAQRDRSDKRRHRRTFSSYMDEPEVERICRERGHHFRNTTLTPGATLKWFAGQMLMGNVSCDAVRHQANGAFSASAYCQARQRLPLAVLADVAHRIVQQAVALAGAGSEHRWLGHRTFRIDGSSASLMDSPSLRGYFGCSGNCKPGCGYPTAHVLLLVGAAGVAIDAIGSPLRTGDMTHASQMHRHLQAGDVLIGDGLFSSFGHLYTLIRQGLHGLFPLHHSRQFAWGRHGEHGPNRRFVKTLGWRDQLVEYRKPAQRPTWMSKTEFAAAPRWIRIREVQRDVSIGGVRRKVIVVSTLTDAAKYPAKTLVKLLNERWTIELNLRSLKTTMRAERLHCRTVEGVKKELMMYLIAYNLVRLLMLEAAGRQRVPFDRLSFADALMRLRYGTDWASWVDLKINPLRCGRIEPRVVKRRPKPFATMSRPRDQLRRLLILQRKRRAA
jgi:Transposase DDE domain